MAAPFSIGWVGGIRDAFSIRLGQGLDDDKNKGKKKNNSKNRSNGKNNNKGRGKSEIRGFFASLRMTTLELNQPRIF